MPVFCHMESFTSLNSSFYCVCIITHTTHCSTGAHSSTGKHSSQPGHDIKADNKARVTTLWPALLETIPPPWAVLDKRLLQSIWVLI